MTEPPKKSGILTKPLWSLNSIFYRNLLFSGIKPNTLLILCVCLAGFTLGLSSCDYVIPQKEAEEVECNFAVIDPIAPVKTVLLEEFTGHGCGQCPSAHEKAAELESFYGDDLIIVGIHAGWFATPGYPGYAELSYDFNTELGTYLNGSDVFNTRDSYPVGGIDRRIFNGERLVQWADWGQHIESQLDEIPVAGLRIHPATVSGQQVEVTVDVQYFEEGNANDLLMVCITEDSVVKPQLDYPGGINNSYVHRHVLRGHLTSTVFGDLLCDEAIPAGGTFSRTYTYELDPSWDPAHCSLVAYVITSDHRILNVTESYLQ